VTALEKFRQQVAIARAGSTYVVQTADEAQALLDEFAELRPVRRLPESDVADDGAVI
jgi:hypothetical protein